MAKTVQSIDGAAGQSGQGGMAAEALLELLVQSWARDAAMLQGDSEAGVLLAHAAEAVEFGLADEERATALHTLGAAHSDADARAFAGRRRTLRRHDQQADVGSVYEDELNAARSVPQRLVAGLGLAQWLLRKYPDGGRTLTLLDELRGLVKTGGPELESLWLAVQEDALLAADRPTDALTERSRRYDLLGALGDGVLDVAGAAMALQTAVLAETASSDPAVALAWYERSLEFEASEEAALPLLRDAWRRSDHIDVVNRLQPVIRDAEDADIRSRWLYTLAMTRAYRREDSAGALQNLQEGMKGGGSATVAAHAFIDLAIRSHGRVVPDDYVDALGNALEFSVDPSERADLLTQMAERFDGDLDLTDAAVEFAHEALVEVSDYRPAIQLLGRIYTRQGAWAQLAKLTESELKQVNDADDRLRLHERLADLYLSDLRDAGAAERHLRAALQIRAHLPSVRRLARVLAEQHRWEDLYEHLMQCAPRVGQSRDRIYLLGQAGDVAESRLRDPDRAIDAYRMMLQISPEHGTAITSLARLLSLTERWSELLELNERELALVPREIATRVAILCRSAEVARRHLGDLSGAEDFYRRALDEDSACDEALRGYGSLLRMQERWLELAEMTERELNVAATTGHRERCLSLLGELYARRLNQIDRAITCYRSLADGTGLRRAESLLWLTRLYAATGRDEALLHVLGERAASVASPQARARIAFRRAEILEWRLRRMPEAFDAYIDGLQDEQCLAAATTAIDRLWNHHELDAHARRRAIETMSQLAENAIPAHRRMLMDMLIAHGDPAATTTRADVLERYLDEWPDALAVGERRAIRLLQDHRPDEAEEVRDACAAGPVELVRGRWAALERGELIQPLGDLTSAWLPETTRFLDRDSGAVTRSFEGAHEREIFARIGRRQVGVRDLLTADGSETAIRLSILASRASNDPPRVFSRWQLLARSLENPLRALRAWLDLCVEEDVNDTQRREWLREAAELGCYDSVLREELYRAFASAGDLEGLQAALQQHLREAPPHPSVAAALSLRRGRCLEALGRQEEAIAALRVAAINAPADTAVALEKSRLETVADRLDDARSTLDDCLDAGAELPGRLEILGRLADLQQMHGGDKARALSALEDAFQLAGGSKDWGIRLANAHASFGQPARCAQLLQHVLPTPVREDDIRHWQLLARVYAQGLDRRSDAESILWMLFESFPDRRGALTGLEEHYRKQGGARIFVEKLGEWLLRNPDKPSPQRLRELWIYVGELHFLVLSQWREAEQAYAQARRAGDDSALILLREGRALARQTGREREASIRLVQALDRAEGEARVWQDASAELDTCYAGMRDTGRLRVIRQIESAFGREVELLDDNIRRDPTRDLDSSSAWELLGARLSDAAAREVATAHAPLAERVLARTGGSRRNLKGRKARGEEFVGFEGYLAAACQTLNVPVPKVVAGDGARGVQVLETRSFWVEADRVAEPNEMTARFWAGYIAGMAFTGWGAFTWGDRAASQHLLLAVAQRGLGRNVPDPGAMADEVSGIMLTAVRRTAAAALREHEYLIGRTDFDPGSWALRFADRMGLLMAGDLTTAVAELLHVQDLDAEFGDAETMIHMASDARILDLMRYAMSDRYHTLRYETGLGQRPLLIE